MRYILDIFLTKCEKFHTLTTDDEVSILSLIILVNLYEYAKEEIHNQCEYKKIPK